MFDGLLPERHNSRLMKLLFVLAEWHGLAKLKMHTEASLDLLDKSTREVGVCLRDFKKPTCAAYATRELRREVEVRKRHDRRSGKKGSGALAPGGANQDADARRPKELNLDLIKVHFLGYYSPTIRTHGTSDSYSTAAVRLVFLAKAGCRAHTSHSVGINASRLNPKVSLTRWS